MNRETLIRPIREFTSRPFDRAASRLAYLGTYLAPTSIIFFSLTKIFEPRPPEHFLGAGLCIIVTEAALGRIRRKIVREALLHGLKLGGGQDQPTKRNTPPNPPTGGTF